LSVILLIVLVASNISPVYANDATYLEEAEVLKNINVFKGSEKGFELEREPTRLEGGIMFVKLLGAESEALENNYPHPFEDVPEWGSPFVGYLYKMGFTSGISDTEFGSNDKMQAKSYMTFLLRALDYDDQSGDFSWNDAIAKSKSINMIDADLEADLNSQVFLRDHLAKISLDALKTQMKDKETTLVRDLVDNNVISEVLAYDLHLLEPVSTNSRSESITTSETTKIDSVLKTIDGVANYKDIDGKRFYRPLTEAELNGIQYDALDTMDIYHNEYTINELKNNYKNVDWDAWMQIKWGKFDWNNNNHGSNLAKDDYWQDYDGNTPATAGSYASSLSLRVASEVELKALFNSLEIGPTEDLGWPSGYYWTSDYSTDGNEYHRFVDTLNVMGQQYNDTRDYFVILVDDKNIDEIISEENNETMKKAPTLTNSESGIFASSQKLNGMKDIPGVANSISVNGVLIYRPLTTEETVEVLGEKKYDFSIPAKYGYSAEKVDDYTVTLAEQKSMFEQKNSNINWDTWFELEWPVYDNSLEPITYGPGLEYEGDYTVSDIDVAMIYADRELTYTPKYLFDTLLEVYPNGEITSVFGWPTNYDYITSSRDEFGNVYTTSLYIESSRVNLGVYDPCYISFVNYSDVIYENLTESSIAE